jgi:hypothetical protein
VESYLKIFRSKIEEFEKFRQGKSQEQEQAKLFLFILKGILDDLEI